MSSYSLENPSQVGRGYVAITILDINDNAPEFAMDYETTVCENAQPGQVSDWWITLLFLRELKKIQQQLSLKFFQLSDKL